MTVKKKVTDSKAKTVANKEITETYPVSKNYNSEEGAKELASLIKEGKRFLCLTDAESFKTAGAAFKHAKKHGYILEDIRSIANLFLSAICAKYDLEQKEVTKAIAAGKKDY
jgi:hypothetical protein